MLVRAPTGDSLRLAFFFAAYFVVVGIQLPFWPVWLANKGLGPKEIGLLLAISIAAKVIANPLAAHLADRSGERRRPMLILAVAAMASFALFGGVDGFWAILMVSVLFFMAWPPIMPLGESLTMITVHRENLDYGRIRLWGSLSFIAAAVISGRVLVDEPADIIFWMVLSATAFAVIACALLPDSRPERITSTQAPILLILRNRQFLLFLLAAALIQGSHAVYYAFGTLHWQAVGYSDDLIGALWAEGVVAEIVLFALGSRLIRRLGPERLIALGGLAAAIRWTVTGATDALPALICVQALHAFSFGATHLGAIHFVARVVSPAMSATAQSLYSAAVMGLGLGIMLLLSGELYERFGGGAFQAMAFLGLLGGWMALVLRQTADHPPSPKVRE